jgi:hypothetical protein
MLSSSGTTTRWGSEPQLTAPGASSSPAPTSAPTMAWVVETGSLNTVEKATHAAAPARTARAKARVGWAETMPLENSLVILSARRSENSEPASVVTVPQRIAVR